MTTLFVVTVFFWDVLAVGWFTAAFESKALCELWVQSNATPIHRAVSVESHARWRTTGRIDTLPQCVAQ